jgi:hypothetical protein
MTNDETKPKRVYQRKAQSAETLAHIEHAVAQAQDAKPEVNPFGWTEQASAQAAIHREMYQVAMANLAVHMRRHNIKED